MVQDDLVQDSREELEKHCLTWQVLPTGATEVAGEWGWVERGLVLLR